MNSVMQYALFDFADTLAELQPSRQSILENYIKRVAGIDVPADLIIRCYKAVDLLMQYSSVRTRTTEQRAEFYFEYNRRMLELLGVLHQVSPEGVFKAFHKQRKHWQLKQGVRETFLELRHRGYNIGIVSNFDTRLEKIIYEHLDLVGVIHYLHISQCEGIEKPDPRFYLSFFEKHSVPIERAIYLGDSYVLDFLPAVSIGLKTWLLDEHSLYPHIQEAVKRVPELLEHLP